jgi:uncharacterized coiled-coil protein SlyX
MTEDRLNRIETTLAHQEQQIEDLSEMIRLQWKEIDLLKRRLDHTQNLLSDLQSNPADEPGEPLSVSEIAAAEKPPHY